MKTMTKNREQIKQRLNEIFQEVFDDEEIRIFNSMTADDHEEWDSVMHITLVITIEKEFGLQLNVAEVGQLENVGIMIDLLMERATK